MKIVFINPAPKIWIKSSVIPLGLAYVASYARSMGYEKISVLDFNINPKAAVPDADIYGITATTPLINNAKKICGIIKQKNKNAFTVIGGPHATCEPEETLSDPNVDFVIRGEGEKAFVSLLEAIENKKSLEYVHGLSYKDKGKFVHNPLNYIENLDELPYPAIDLFPDLKYYSHPQPLIGWRKPAVNIITSRGCPFACYFCYKGTFGKKWRARSAESVVDEWEYLVKKVKIRELGIQDDIFNTDIKRAKKIMKMVIERGIKIPFTFPNGIRADLIDEELVVLMKKAGLYRTAVGIESGVQEVLDTIGKNEKLSDIENAVKLFKRHGIQTIAFYVIGHPADSEHTIELTIKHALKLNPTFAQFAMATPFPGTALYEEVKKTGTLKIKNWDEYSQFDSKGYFDYPHLKGNVIASYVKKAYRSFYINPVFLLKIIMLPDFYMKIPDYIRGFLHFLVKGR